MGGIGKPAHLRRGRRRRENAGGCKSHGAIAAKLRGPRHLPAYAADVSECLVQILHGGEAHNFTLQSKPRNPLAVKRLVKTGQAGVRTTGTAVPAHRKTRSAVF